MSKSLHHSDSPSSQPSCRANSGPLVPHGERHLGPLDFEILRLVGTGNFSEVFHVQRRLTKSDKTAQKERERKGMTLVTDGIEYFAMKKIDKMLLKKLHKEPEVLMEKHCLTKLNSYQAADERSLLGLSNIIKLYWTFQDEEALYLIMEFCPDGELWETVAGIGLLDEQLSIYYIAQLINALEFVHGRGIVHRDLKAENILIGRDGILKLIDFGSAIDTECVDVKVAGNRSSGIRGHVYKHFVGTAQFMAPESVQNKGFGRLCDLWSLGCTIYQIIAGVPPFNGPSEFLTYLLSTNADYDFPPHFPVLAQDLVRSLLQLDPEKRLSAADTDFSAIRSHPYFAGVDFSNLQHLVINRKPHPPLRDLCLSHMAKNWERWKVKWMDHGWLLADGTLPSIESRRKEKEKEFNDVFCVSPMERSTLHDQMSQASLMSQASGRDIDLMSHASGRDIDLMSQVTDQDIDLMSQASGRDIDLMSQVTDQDVDSMTQTTSVEMTSKNGQPLLTEKIPSSTASIEFNWNAEAEPIGLELKCRELIKVKWFGCKPEERRAQERLLYLKSIDDPQGFRNEAFWDEKVQKFLKKDLNNQPMNQLEGKLEEEKMNEKDENSQLSSCESENADRED